MSVAIGAYGCVFGRFGLARDVLDKVGARAPAGWSWSAIPGPDEDALTLGLAAARQVANDVSAVRSVGLASTSLALARGVNAGLLVYALALDPCTFVTEHTTSARAGTEALASHAARCDLTKDSALVVATETRSGADRPTASAGAAAILLQPDDGLATIEAVAHICGEYPGLDFVNAGDSERRDVDVPDYAAAACTDMIQAAAARVLTEVDVPLGAYKQIVLAGLDAGLAAKAARILGADRSQWVDALPYGFGGDMSAASGLVGLAAALDRAEIDDWLLLLSYAGGSAVDAVAVRVRATRQAGVLSTRASCIALTVSDYFRYRGAI